MDILNILGISYGDYHEMKRGYHIYYTYDRLRGLIDFHIVKTLVVFLLLAVCIIFMIKEIRMVMRMEKSDLCRNDKICR